MDLVVDKSTHTHGAGRAFRLSKGWQVSFMKAYTRIAFLPMSLYRDSWRYFRQKSLRRDVRTGRWMDRARTCVDPSYSKRLLTSGA